MPSSRYERFAAAAALAAGEDKTGDDGRPEADSPAANEARFDRLAELIAAGEMEFPEALPSEQSEVLIERVRRRRRARLIALIARQIALHLARQRASGESG